MDHSFVTAVQGALNRPHTEIVAGEERLLIPQGWVELKREIPAPAPLVVNTLTGFVHYVQANVDSLSLYEHLVHVKDHNTVELRAKLEEDDTKFRRRHLLTATTALVAVSPLKFGEYYEAEHFFIALQSLFVPTPTREELLLLIASIRENNVRESTDDGVSQQVNVAQGVTFVGTKRVPNPVTLAPFRTFREVEQPASPFVLRLRQAKEGDRPQIALFEADGGRWKLDAIQNIAAYLRGQLGALHVIA